MARRATPRSGRRWRTTSPAPAPGWRSTTVTSWPSAARYHAAVMPTTPAPRTTMRIGQASAARRAGASRASRRRRRSRRPGRSCRTDCDRRRRCRRAPTGGQYFARAQRRRRDTRPARASSACVQSSAGTAAAVCGAFFSGLSARSARPSSIARISSRIAIIASMKRSSSAFDSLSVGSTISVPAHREAHRRRVEAVVDQPLGDVVDRDAARLLERPQVEDAFVRDEAARARVEHRVVRREALRDVVRGEDRGLGRGREARRRPSSRCTSTRSAGSTRCRTAPPTPAPIASARRAGRCAMARAGTARDARRRATGPTPGPPPPCGMQNVLCRFRCETSAPNSPGAARPTSAFRLAPSTYTWPPCACTISQISRMPASNTPCVDG